MARVKAVIIVNEHFETGGKYNIKYRITHKGKVGHVSSGMYVKKEQFSGGLVRSHPLARNYNKEITEKLSEIESLLIQDKRIASMSMNEILKELRREPDKQTDFYRFMDGLIRIEAELNHVSVEVALRSTRKVLKEYSPKLSFEDITYKWLTEFDHYLKTHKTKRKHNTLWGYYKTIRKVFNQAIAEEEISQDIYPFRKFKLKKENAIRRNLPLETIRELYRMDLKRNLALSRDIFMLSFFLMGMNMKDLLLHPQPKKGVIQFKRFKTGTLLSIEIHPAAQEIIDRYRGDKLMLNLAERYDNYKYATERVNRGLRKIRETMELETLSTYSARHSWATIAFRLGVEKDVISTALGHEFGSKTTGIYVEIDFERANRANRTVIEAVLAQPLSYG